jgi:hypothetical protein
LGLSGIPSGWRLLDITYNGEDYTSRPFSLATGDHLAGVTIRVEAGAPILVRDIAGTEDGLSRPTRPAVAAGARHREQDHDDQSRANYHSGAVPAAEDLRRDTCKSRVHVFANPGAVLNKSRRAFSRPWMIAMLG